MAAVIAAANRVLERESVSDAIGRLLDDARTGSGGTLFLIGEAGLGKTAALEEALRHVPPDMRVGLGRGDAMEVSLPFGLLAQALEGLGGRDVLSWTVDASSAADARTAQFFRVLRWLEEISTDAPVLLALDDLHWADPDSLALLSFLCRRIASLPVAVIATLRPWPPQPLGLCTALAQPGHASIERLAPLSEAAAQELIAGRLSRTVPEAMVRRAWSACSGNPFLLEQVARAIDRGDDVLERNGQGMRHLGSDVLLARFAGLSRVEVRFAQAACVMGDRFCPELAAEVARLDPAEVDAILEALCASGLVRQVSAGWTAFAHPLFCQALHDDIPEPLRARLHARIFAVLAARGMEAEAAEHAIRGGLVGQPEAVALLERAGRAALRIGAPATAARHLQAAVEFSGDQNRAALLMALGEALLAAGHARDAVPVLERLLAHAQVASSSRVVALRMLGRALFGTGAHELAALRFAEAVELAQHDGPLAAIDVLIDHALSSWGAEGPARALPLAARARDLAGRASPALRRRAEAALGFLRHLCGDGAGLAMVAAASRAVETDPLSHQAELCWTGSALVTHGYTAMYAERFDEAQRVLAVAMTAAERMGAGHAVATIAVGQSGILIRRGRLGEARDQVLRADAVSDVFPMIRPFTGVRHAQLHLHAGRLDESEEWCRRVEEMAVARGESLALLWISSVRGLRWLRSGDLAQACDAYARAEELTHRMGIGEPCAVPWARGAIAAYLGAGRIDDARRVIAWLEACAERLPCHWPRIAAAAGRGLLAAHMGEHDEAETQFLCALDLHDEVELPLERVETLLDHGSHLRRSGQPVRARSILAEALQLAEECGSVWLAGQARAELTVAGGRRRRARGPEELTAQEQRVALLAAEGKTNQEMARQMFLAVRTVENHLERIYAKLGIHSRRELMAMPSRIGGLEPVGAG